MKSRFERALALAERTVPLLSHLAQVGLFALTAWGLFHTVIPLYQKAVVDEQVAKQQVQLTQLTQRLQENYDRNRKLIAAEFARIVGPACSGLLTPAPDQSKPGSKDFYTEALGTDVEKCLSDQLQVFAPLKDLTKPDQDALSRQVHHIGEHLNAVRLTARMEYNLIAVTGPSVGPIFVEKSAQQALATMKLIGASDQQMAEATRKMAAQRRQGLVIKEYLDEFTRNMVILRSMSWPPITSSE
ncbi:hypothetical protein AB0305_01610 [Arthrobacter sp. NPDC080086]|uniref:hypothetical protein n=1 Tax=Arthrobacter sp. NPDC080086 TaxID=3155917 RepID=UPI003450E0DA